MPRATQKPGQGGNQERLLGVATVLDAWCSIFKGGGRWEERDEGGIQGGGMEGKGGGWVKGKGWTVEKQLSLLFPSFFSETLIKT